MPSLDSLSLRRCSREGKYLKQFLCKALNGHRKVTIVVEHGASDRGVWLKTLDDMYPRLVESAETSTGPFQGSDGVTSDGDYSLAVSPLPML